MRLIALVGLLVTQLASAAPVAPPVADVRPREVSSANGMRIDPYFWLRDDTRSDPQVLAYLRAENAYKDAMLSHTKTLQEKLYGEIVARIKQDDSTAPYLRGGYWYYRRYQPGGEHPIYARKRTPEEAEEILVDGNERSRGHGYYDLGAVEISPDSRYVAFAEDTVGRYQYAIRVRDMRTGKLLPDVLENVETDIAWTNDNRTFLYVAKHPVTLLGLYVKRHALGSSADADRLLFEQTDTAFYTRVARSKSGRFVFVFMESTLSSEWRYAAPDKVVAMGGSAGGLLMGAVANMAPEKYRAIIAEVPFVDVVTTMLDDTIPLTSNEYDEWGNPDDRKAYEYMLSYSPYDQVARQAYPAMLVTTGLWDSQGQYFEPAKWVAKLRAMKTDAHPLLLHTNMEAGHAGHTGRFQQYRELALEYAFALDQLGIRE